MDEVAGSSPAPPTSVARSSVVVVGDLATLVCSWWMNLRPEGGCGGTSVPPGGKGRNRRGLATPRREPRRQIPFGAPTAIGRRGRGDRRSEVQVLHRPPAWQGPR